MNAPERLVPDTTDATSKSVHALLEQLRSRSGARHTIGLSAAVIEAHAQLDPRLHEALSTAVQARMALPAELSQLMELDEPQAVHKAQIGFLNFYPQHAVNPFIPLAARGPWVVTTHGAVLHDNGGYGMLGFGHAPADVLDTMAAPHVMANIMTASLSHRKFIDALRLELGHARDDQPFHQYLCLNSGSESVEIASRISDIHAWNQVRPGGEKEGQKIKFLALQGAFHGRTSRPAQVSHSTRPKYEAALASFQGTDNLIVVEPNNVADLEAAFAQAEADGVFIESMFLEPVMGEGRPGRRTTRAFYDAARRLTRAHGSLLIVDSIQAGLRATGALSIVDYPGFEDCDGPDMETWSKALNAGQYPLSVLGMNQRASEIYVRGVYGNTMTGNPRALEVACTVLSRFTTELRQNIRRQGARFVEGLQALQADFPHIIQSVEGTGLLFCCELDPERYAVTGTGGIEEQFRIRGIGVIHGGRNALRFTPNFDISTAEVELVLGELRALFETLD
jgi:acetylornithine/succinyldiaminopimelate/putrescine aminotransferase